MGSISVGFMDATDELTITDLEFTPGDAESGRIVVYVTNSGTSRYTIENVRVNAEIISEWSSGTSDTIPPGASETITITHEVLEGYKYSVAFIDPDGTVVGAYIATA